MKITYGYGKGTREFSLDEKNLLCEMVQNEVPVTLTGQAEVRRAMEEPIGSPRLRELVRPGERIAIVTSDITRPCPTSLMLPVVMEELQAAGVAAEDVTVVFALGSHRRHTEEEQKYLMGEEWYGRVRCVDSDTENAVHMGETPAGTPVDVDPTVAAADRRICLGNIEYHYFAGYSGGAKAIMPGVSTRAAIQANHSKMVLDEARAGNLEGNPLRRDIEDAIALVPVDFILNVVLDEQKTVIKAVAGHYQKAHRAGCAFLDTLYKVRIPRRADIVVATPGGFPKDLNLYQAQKALDNSKHAVREGGIVILAGSCAEGLGEKVFERWMTTSPSPEFMVEEIARNFELGGHKAAAIAMVLAKARIFLVSDLDPEFVRGIFMEPFPDVDSALAEAFSQLGEDAQVIFMPHAGSTLPSLD